MSNVASVITTTNNTVVESANSAVSIGRWSSLAIIAFSPFSAVLEAAKTPLLLLVLLLRLKSIDELSDGAAHATLTFAQTTSAVKGTDKASNINTAASKMEYERPMAIK